MARLKVFVKFEEKKTLEQDFLRDPVVMKPLLLHLRSQWRSHGLKQLSDRVFDHKWPRN